jgi:signal transduction histidine kinase/ligand-binding sensor domain-containing protein
MRGRRTRWGGGWARWHRGALAVLIAVVLPASILGKTAPAVAPADGFAPYKHVRWTPDDGAPTGLKAMVQAADGFLVVAAESGLYRFDGSRFEPIPDRRPGALAGTPPSTLMRARNGDIWIGYTGRGGVQVLRGGRLIDAAMPEAQQQIIALVEDADGAIWSVWGGDEDRIRIFRRGQWSREPKALALPPGYLTDLKVLRDGTMLVAIVDPSQQTSRVATLRRGAVSFVTQPIRTHYGRFAVDHAGRVWLSDRFGTRPLQRRHDGSWSEGVPRYPVAEDLRLPRFVVDRRGDVWGVGTPKGLFHIAHAARGPGVDGGVQLFDAARGLTDSVGRDVLEDREGNIWHASGEGLDRFSVAKAALEPAVPADTSSGLMIAAAKSGSVFVGSQGTLFEAKPGRPARARLALKDGVGAMCAGRDGVWVAQSRRFLQVEAAGVRSVPSPMPEIVKALACSEDETGRLWVGTMGPLYWRDAGGWHAIAPDRLGASMVSELASDGNGGVVLNLAGDHVGLVSGSRITRWRAADVGLGQILRVSPGAQGPLVTGTRGIARIKGGTLQVLDARRYPWAVDLRGVVQTAAGETWLSSGRSIIRLSSGELDRALDAPGRPIRVKVYDSRDGVRNLPQHPGYRGPQMASGADGRVWSLTPLGVLVLDPAAIGTNPVPPTVRITRLASPEAGLPAGGGVLPQGTRTVSIGFAALNLSQPQRVRFRYRLEGVDEGWVDAGSRREASYGNLGPGSYGFRVVAANEDGVWSPVGARTRFEIPPTFWQTRTFLGLCIAAAAALLWLLYMLRVRQVAARIRVRLEDRVAERERIARDLHDTFLQSLQGLIMRFHGISMRKGVDAESRTAMKDAVDMAERALVEGRQRVAGLAAGIAQDPAADLKAFAASLPAHAGSVVTVDLTGEARALRPLVADEAARIGREALFNATRHACASRIVARVGYGSADFVLQVEDDGVGIDSATLAAGRDGHFGLRGMRDRARRCGGVLTIKAPEGGGTSVMLRVPARCAYVQVGPLASLRQLFGRPRAPEA